MQIIVYHSKARKTMCGMGTFCLIGMISLQLTIQNGELNYRFTDGTMDSPLEVFKRNWSALPNLKTITGTVANGNYAAGFLAYKHTTDYGSVFMISYSNSFPTPLFSRLVNGTWVDS